MTKQWEDLTLEERVDRLADMLRTLDSRTKAALGRTNHVIGRVEALEEISRAELEATTVFEEYLIQREGKGRNWMDLNNLTFEYLENARNHRDELVRRGLMHKGTRTRIVYRVTTDTVIEDET